MASSSLPTSGVHHEVRIREDHLVAGVDQHEHRQKQRSADAGGYQVRPVVIIPAEFLLAQLGHGRSQLGGALGLGVLVPPVADGLDRAVLYGFGHVEIGLADGQVDRVLQLGGQVEDLAYARGVEQTHAIGDGVAVAHHVSA